MNLSVSISDLGLLDSRKFLHYIVFRLGGAGYWAEVPIDYIREVPIGSLLKVEGNTFMKVLAIDSEYIQTENLLTGVETKLYFSQLGAITDVFIVTKEWSEEVSFDKGSPLFLPLFVLQLFPISLTSLLFHEVLFANWKYAIITLLAFALIAVLSLVMDRSNEYAGLVCSEKKKCSGLFDQNPFHLKWISPVSIGSAFCSFVLTVIGIQNYGFPLILVVGLALIANFYLIWYRTQVAKVSCRICNWATGLSIFLCVGVLLVIDGAPEFNVWDSILLLLLGSLCMVYHEIIARIDKNNLRMERKSAQLKLIQSDTATFKLWADKLDTVGLFDYGSITPNQKFTIFQNLDAENNEIKVLHAVISPDCPHCKELVNQLLYNLEFINADIIQISVAGRDSAAAKGLALELDAHRGETMICCDVLEDFYSGKRKPMVVRDSLHRDIDLIISVPHTPLLFLNGKVVSNLYAIEDLSFHLSYS